MKYTVVVFGNSDLILYDKTFPDIDLASEWLQDHFPNWSVKDKYAINGGEFWEVWVN